MAVCEQQLKLDAIDPSDSADSASDDSVDIADITPFLGQTLVFLHLFSGRRRAQDLQMCMEQDFLNSGYNLVVLSIDIIYGEIADLTNASRLLFWIRMVRQGRVFGAAGGPPCETWSTARYLPDGPGPLRSRDAPFGISSIQSMRQLWQIIFGNTLLFVALEFAAECIAAGAMAIIEHPAVTALHGRYNAPSIWKLSIMNWFKSCAVVDFVTLFAR